MGGSKPKSKTYLFDPESTKQISSELRGFASQVPYAPLRQDQLSQIAQSPYSQPDIQEQLAAVGLGSDQARRQIQETTRSQATARGLFSSGGAIAEEAAGLSQIPMQEAAQRAQILQQGGQRQLQALGMLSEQDLRKLQLQLQALGAAGGLSGQMLSSSKGGSPGLGGIVGGIAGGLFGGTAGFTAGSTLGGQY